MRAFLLVFLLAPLAAGHRDLHKQIVDISIQIESAPNNPQLWLTRASLHQSHQDFKAARLDLLEATRITPKHPPAFLKLAQFDRKRGHPPMARKALNTYFTLAPSPDPLAYREKALLSPPNDTIEHWRLFLSSSSPSTMLDYVLAAQASLDATHLDAAADFLRSGLLRHPKSIQLHQLRARASLINLDTGSAIQAFTTLKLLYPNLRVKLSYEESLIWADYKKEDNSRRALRAALDASQKLAPRFKENRDMQSLVIEIKKALQQ